MHQRTDQARMKSILKGRASLVVWLVALLLALPLSTRAQQDSQTQTPSDTDSPSVFVDSQRDSPPYPPVIASLDTGQTLNGGKGAVPAGRASRMAAVLSWRKLSLLSFSSFYTYDSNYTFQRNPTAVNALAIDGLVLYSIGGERTALDFQYRPYVLVSEVTRQADFAANSLDLHTYHYLSPRWLLNLDDRFQYAPDQGRLVDPTLSVDFTKGIFTRQPFLANGQESLTNGLSIGLSDRFSGPDTFSFHGNYEYVDMWNAYKSSTTLTSTSTSTSPHQENTVGGGISWSHEIRPDQQFGVAYNYDRQLIGGEAAQKPLARAAQYHSLLLNYSQRIRPSVLVQLSFGPSLQIHGNGARSTKTFVGTAEILKTFHASNIALSYARDYDYTGIISNSYHDRYDVSYTRTFGRRWDFSTGVGYIEQGSSHSGTFRGRTEWSRLGYYLTPRLSTFVSFMNSSAAGGPQPYASRNLITAGLRWGYARERPNQ